MKTRNWSKFAEPQGWALKWVFTQETARSTEQQKPEQSGREKFSEPQGWALKWDGSALPDTEKEQQA